MMKTSMIAIALAFAAAPSLAAETAEAKFQDRNGQALGSAVLTQTPNGVLIALGLEGLPPGELAFHVHERGQCTPGDGFESAGGHFAPGGKSHGYLDKGGPHAGDMPNVFVSDNGVLRAHVLNARISLAAGDATLLDRDGSALVIHAKPDDYRSQPSGAAGERIACAVVQAAPRK